ncbi:MAG: DUF1207 domain-containing protein [Ignavibacteriae bacterium]|nr:DUF1207 domain-containing protein [Ignavibacteriota bacterium]MCB9206601.1 DUF1207 domain-containing protein [Ignavibacteriales bacterium]MCB9209689.1 DUF1207 domain-containing protein [Ignavibacteriales bacterium]MCB9218845.1 DUF1207 domain-containing protein [Ignavibacteriales bacterium]
MKIKFLAIFVLFFSTFINSQNISQNSVQLFSPGLHFLPFKANYQEARLGILYYTSNANLKVDIGNNVDLVRINLPVSKSIISLSVEFMGYALSTSYKGNRLQIDALDGFFGGNVAFSKEYEEGKLISRFRIIHNSAHLVDGHYDRNLDKWINDDEPIPFTRDFGELTLGYQFYPDFGIIRTYGTAAYSTLVRPSEIQKWSSYFGYEIAFDKIIEQTFGVKTNLFLANQFNLVGTPKYQLNSKFMSGVKFGEWDGKGLVLYLSYYTGANPFSEYYSQRIQKFGIGFFIDFF